MYKILLLYVLQNVFKAYVKNPWFVLDILCAFPFGWIMLGIGVPAEEAGVYRLVKLVKLFRFFGHMETIWKILESYRILRNTLYQRMLTLFIGTRTNCMHNHTYTHLDV